MMEKKIDIQVEWFMMVFGVTMAFVGLAGMTMQYSIAGYKARKGANK